MERKDTDNFAAIINYMMGREPDGSFFHLQILQRKKEHPELGRNSRVVKTFYVRDHDHLLKLRGDIYILCYQFQARAYINLNPRSYEKVAFGMLVKISNQILNKDFENVKNAYESVTGAASCVGQKVWVVDIDTKDEEEIKFAKSAVIVCDPGPAVLMEVPTKNGVHLITEPFNTQQFKEYYKTDGMFPVPDIQKNNPTVLYIPEPWEEQKS